MGTPRGRPSSITGRSRAARRCAMPVRSLRSSVLKWPDRGTVEQALAAWAARERLRHPALLRLGWFGSYARGDAGGGGDPEGGGEGKRGDLGGRRIIKKKKSCHCRPRVGTTRITQTPPIRGPHRHWRSKTQLCSRTIRRYRSVPQPTDPIYARDFCYHAL